MNPVARLLTFFAIVLGFVGSTGCGGLSRANLYDGPPLGEPEYRLGVADVLAVEVKDNPSFSIQQATVRPDGQVTLPLVDDVRVVGLTPAQVRAEVVRKLEAFIKQPMVTVSLVQLNSYSFYVLGRVQNPNRYTSHGLVTVLQALAMAGDVTPYATPENIVVIRRFPDGQRRIRFDYPAVVDGTRLQENIHIETGDVVYVP
jgi:polysaccharide export outer membrane protein